MLTVANNKKAVSSREHFRTGWHSRRDLPRGIRIQALEQSTTHWWKIRPKLHLLTLFLIMMMIITTMLARQPRPAKTRRIVADIFLCSASSSGHVSPFLAEVLFTLSIVLTRWTVLLSWGTRWIERRRNSSLKDADIFSSSFCKKICQEWSPTIPRLVTHQPNNGHPPEGSVLQTQNLALFCT